MLIWDQSSTIDKSIDAHIQSHIHIHIHIYTHHYHLFLLLKVLIPCIHNILKLRVHSPTDISRLGPEPGQMSRARVRKYGDNSVTRAELPCCLNGCDT